MDGGKRTQLLLVLALCIALSALMCGPASARRNIVGIHEHVTGSIMDIEPYQLNWCKNLVGKGGFVEDWIYDALSVTFINGVYQREMFPIVRLEPWQGGGCEEGEDEEEGVMPDAGWIAEKAMLMRDGRNAAYKDLPLYIKVWNEPADKRDWCGDGCTMYSDFLVDVYSRINQIDTNDTIFVCTPGQNGTGCIQTMVTHNANFVNSWDVWGTHPYPECSPPSYNHHDGSAPNCPTLTLDSYLPDIDEIAEHGSRRGFPIMILETAYADALGHSLEGYPKTSLELAAQYNVDAYQNYWGKWPEIKAVCPFLLYAPGWHQFQWVNTKTGTDANGWPTSPKPMYTAVANMPKQPSMGGIYRGPKGTISGYVKDESQNNIKYAEVFTNDYEYGWPSLYDGQYKIGDVPAGTYTLTAVKMGYESSNQQVTVTNGQNTTANFNLTYRGGKPVGIYFLSQAKCPDCQISASSISQTFKTPADCGWITFASCWIGGDWNANYTLSILDGGPTGSQIGPSLTVHPQSGVDPIGSTWPDGAVPVVGNHTYCLKVAKVGGGNIYNYMDNTNPYADGCAYQGTTPNANWDMLTTIKGKTALTGTTPTGAIAGRVTDVTTGAALTGASVVTDPDGYSGMTNAQGNYLITGVKAKTYTITASKAGYTSAQAVGKVVVANQTLTVDFALAQSMTGVFAGKVTDTGGTALPGITVQANIEGYKATTDSSGNYTIAGVEPCSSCYSLTASGAGYQTSTQSSLSITTGQTTTVNFSLTAVFGGLANKDFEGGFFNDPDVDHKTANSWHRFYTAGTPKCGDHVGTEDNPVHSGSHAQTIYESSWTAGIYQQCTGATSGNTYEASVWVRANDGGSIMTRIGIDPSGGTSATSTNIQWYDPAFGASTGWAQIFKQAAATASTITVFVKAQNTAGTNKYVYIDDANVVDLGASGTGTLQGTVKTTGAVAIPDATVQLEPGGNTTTTDANGFYKFVVLRGTYNVTASKVGYQVNQQTNKTVNSGQTTTVNFTLTAAGTQYGTIAGTVKDSSNNAITGATVRTLTGNYSTTTNGSGAYTLANVEPGIYDVRASKSGYSDGTIYGQQVNANQTTTVNFTLASSTWSGLQNGNMEGGFFNDPDVDHKSPNYWKRFYTAGTSKSGDHYTEYHSSHWSLTIYEANWTAGVWQRCTGATVNNKYTASVWVKGYDTNLNFWVGIDPKGGTDATSADVQWSGMSTPGTTWTQISRQAVANTGAITVFLKAQNVYAAQSRAAWIDDAALSNDGSAAVGAIAGTVKDSSGAGIATATVSTTSGGYSTLTAGDGSYTINNVATSTYTVQAVKSGYNTGSQSSKTVSENQTTTVNFTLTAASNGGITGTVKDGSGTAISGATVQTTTGGYSTTSNGGGSYTLTNVTPSTYTVQASKSGYVTDQQTNVTVAGGQTTTQNFTLFTNFAGLSNASFEGTFVNDPDADHKVGEYWHRYSLAGSSKSGGDYGNYHGTGHWGQAFWESSWTAGVYQQCTGSMVGQTYTAKVWVKSSDTGVNFWVGVDPYGGTDVSSSNVAWSSVSAPGTTWTQISKQVSANASTITMFIKAQNTVGSNRNAFMDDCSFATP